jgi:uncharacterized RDD family membrane protein YckC/type II secretory pathway pseudopilin PulG
MFCTECGRENPDVAKFCFACGRALLAGSEPAGTGPYRPPSARVADPELEFSQDRYAGFWIRVAAAVIDGWVIVGMGAIGALVLGAAGLLTDTAPEAAVAGYYIVALSASWLYFALSESSSKQATWGKRAVGIVVTDVGGNRLSFGRASGRAFAKWLNELTFGIGWIAVALTEKKRGLHDFLAGSFVVVREPRKNRVAVVVVVCALAFVPIIGIIAAIAVPGLLRARMSGNETSAIRTLRTINIAQEQYALQCRGYAPTLRALGARPGEFLSPELTSAETVGVSGYEIALIRSASADAVANSPPGCEGAVTEYFAQAVPINPGSTGVRFFATDSNGTIYQDVSEKFENPTPVEP